MKAILKRSAIRLMAVTPVLRAMNRLLNHNPIIFTLHRRTNPEHGIGGHEPAMLRQQIKFILQNGYRAVTMDVIDAWVNGEDMDMTNTVAFTFDDGYQDQAELVREVFLPLGVPASMFLITDFIDGRLWPWDARISWLVHHAPDAVASLHAPSTGLQIQFQPDAIARRALAHRLIAHLQHRPPEVLEAAIGELAASLGTEIAPTPPECHAALTWKDARKLENAGIRFGSHTKSHYIVSTLTKEESWRQISGARERLQAQLAAPLPTFAYPIGNRSDYSGRDLKILSEAGHSSAVTMASAVVERPDGRRRHRNFVISRFGMPGDMDDFIQYVSWIERFKERVRAVAPSAKIRRRYGNPRAMVEAIRVGFDYRLGRLRYAEDVDWSLVQRLVFVCQGNVCRSPFAEAVARQRNVPAISLGLQTNPGTPVNPIASRIALEMDVDMTDHTSQRFDPTRLRDGDLILAMEPAQLAGVSGHTSAASVQCTLLGLQLPDSKAPHLADPYGLSDDYHRRCFGMIQSAVKSMGNMLSHQQSPNAATPRGERKSTVRAPGNLES